MLRVHLLLLAMVLAAAQPLPASLASAAQATDATYEQAQALLGPELAQATASASQPQQAQPQAQGAEQGVAAEAAAAAPEAPAAPAAEAAPAAPVAPTSPTTAVAVAGRYGRYGRYGRAVYVAPSVTHVHVLRRASRRPTAERLMVATKSQLRMEARLRALMHYKNVEMRRHLERKIDELAATQAQMQAAVHFVRKDHLRLVRGHQVGRVLADDQAELTRKTHEKIAELDRSIQEQHKQMWKREQGAMASQDMLQANLNSELAEQGHHRMETAVEGAEALSAQESQAAAQEQGELATAQNQLRNVENLENVEIDAQQRTQALDAETAATNLAMTNQIGEMGNQAAAQQGQLAQEGFQQNMHNIEQNQAVQTATTQEEQVNQGLESQHNLDQAQSQAGLAGQLSRVAEHGAYEELAQENAKQLQTLNQQQQNAAREAQSAGNNLMGQLKGLFQGAVKHIAAKFKG